MLVAESNTPNTCSFSENTGLWHVLLPLKQLLFKMLTILLLVPLIGTMNVFSSADDPMNVG